MNHRLQKVFSINAALFFSVVLCFAGNESTLDDSNSVDDLIAEARLDATDSESLVETSKAIRNNLSDCKSEKFEESLSFLVLSVIRSGFKEVMVAGSPEDWDFEAEIRDLVHGLNADEIIELATTIQADSEPDDRSLMWAPFRGLEFSTLLREQMARNRGDDGQPSPEASPSPRPRPRLDPFAVPAPLMQSNQVASRQGQIAVDAKFSEYGEYLQRLVEAVSRAWNASVSRVELNRERLSRVRVRFTLNSQGKVNDVRIVDKSPNAQSLATGLCMDAIQSRSPYDQWTEHMVQNLGTEQEITFTFYYY